MNELRSITINKSAHYHLAGSPTHPKKLLIVFHGYTQLAKSFIKQFKQIVDKGILVVAPEGTNYFYYGAQKQVGSTWMTSLYRESDIDENNAFLNAVLEEIKREFTSIEYISVLGFSQGVATAMRWLSQADIPIDKLILWAGTLPIDFFSMSNIVAEEYYFVHGNRDTFKEGFLASKKKLKEECGSRFKDVTFNGGHAIDREVMQKIFRS